MNVTATLYDSIDRVDAAAWDACAQGHPFVRHAFFLALERSGAVTRERGVVPRYLVLKDAQGQVMACAPGMFKVGNKREFGPEIRWLRRGAEQGCFAWPKFQLGVPFFLVAGPRLLVRAGAPVAPWQDLLLRTLEPLVQTRFKTTAFNLMHIDQPQAAALQARGWLLSQELRSLWLRAGHADWPAYLASLPHRKRRKLLREREQASASGLRLALLQGQDLTPRLVADFYLAHRRVCAEHGNRPWLPEAFWHQLAAAMPEAIRLFAAFDGEALVAATWCLVDAQTLYVQTWGAMQPRCPALFELLCYAPIEYALAHGLEQIDAALAGAHKRSRGFADDRVFHAHRFFDPRLQALAEQALAGADPASAPTPAAPPTPP